MVPHPRKDFKHHKISAQCAHKRSLRMVTDAVNDYFLQRELRGAGGGGGGGGHGGGGHHGAAHRKSGSSSTCKPSYHNVTIGNITTLEKKSCPSTLTYLAFLAVIPFLVCAAFVFFTRRAKRASHLEQKVSSCAASRHQLTLATATVMVSEGHRNYTEGWICDQCNRAFKFAERDTPFHRCSLCQVDLCTDCFNARMALAVASPASTTAIFTATQVDVQLGKGQYEMVPQSLGASYGYGDMPLSNASDADEHPQTQENAQAQGVLTGYPQMQGAVVGTYFLQSQTEPHP